MNKLMMTVVATMALAAFAQGPEVSAAGEKASAQREMRLHHRPPMTMGGAAMEPIARAVMNPRVADQIGLSEEQKPKLAALRGGRSVDKELQKKVRAGMEKQVELLKAEKIDEAAVMQAIDEVFEARKEIAKAQTKRTIEIRSILTPEQVTKALEAMRDLRSSRPRPNGPKARDARREAPKAEAPAAAEPVAK